MIIAKRLTQSVGLSTFAMIFYSCSFSFCANVVFMLMGTRDDTTAVGMMDSSSVICAYPDITPSSSAKTWSKFILPLLTALMLS